jgi:tetratricopeptide (TPR) repeat protein
MKSIRVSPLETVFIIAALAFIAGLGQAVAAGASEPPDLDRMRERLAATETPEQWEKQARELLAVLDRQGLSRSPEAFALVEQLIGVAPEDPVLLWRRADMERRSGRTEEAIADLEYLIEMAGDHPLAVRARRALPALFLRVGRPEESARADEVLLTEGLADPVAVSIRLAHTYAALDRPEALRRTLARLESLDPSKLDTDPELMWLDARATEGAGDTRTAAEKLLRFANLHTTDNRRTEAMVRAAELYADLDRRGLAIGLLREVIASEPELGLAMEARLRLARLLQADGQVDQSLEQLTTILDEALDPETVAGALRLLLEGTERREGLEAAVGQATSLIAAGDRFHVEMARNHLDRLIRELEPSLQDDPARLLYYYEMLRAVEQEMAFSPAARLTVAGELERMGLREQAATVYRTVVGHFGPEREQAHEGLVRTAPRETPAETREELEQRLRALAREEAWDEILRVVDGDRISPEAEAEILAIAARSLFEQGDLQRIEDLLDGAKAPDGRLAALRGDARALTGSWNEACGDYRLAADAEAEGALAAWLEWRLVLCDARSGRSEEASKRLDALRSGEPGPPVEVLVEAPADAEAWMPAFPGTEESSR